jgi:catechol 2,3-dioxygenase-like lactoylglutathione lyase family enzyme
MSVPSGAEGAFRLAAWPYVGFVAVRDLASARRFYVESLGLACVEETPFALVVEANGTQVRLTPVPDLEVQPFTVAGWVVPDLEAAVDALVAAGVAFRHFSEMEQDERGIWTAPSGDRVAWFSDPDGNTLSLTSGAHR